MVGAWEVVLCFANLVTVYNESAKGLQGPFLLIQGPGIRYIPATLAAFMRA